MKQPYRVLVVEDDLPLLRAMKRILTGVGYDVVVAENGHDALLACEGQRFDAVVSDVSMPGLSGIELMRVVRERDLDVPFIIQSGNHDPDRATKAREMGAFEYLSKPVSADALTQVIDRAIRLGKIARVKREAIEVLAVSHHRASDRIGLETVFASAMNGLWAAFQPVVGANGSCYGYEALMRSSEPALPHPGAVLDAAEQLGRLSDLGARMRDLTATAISEDTTGAYFFVNLHPRDLFDPAMLDPSTPLAAMARRVVLEITERASLESLGDAHAQVSELRALGYQLAIDDLGAGYAGLTAFAVLEPEFVKLDMSLVRGIETSSVKQKLIRTMTSLCHDLGIVVVAEGIETQGELDWILHLECDLLQGYLLGRPGRPFPAVHWP